MKYSELYGIHEWDGERFRVLADKANSSRNRYWSVDLVELDGEGKPIAGTTKKLGTRCTWEQVLRFASAYAK